MLQEPGKAVELVHEADEFLKVFEPRMRLWRLVGLPHGGVAAFVQDQLGEFRVAHGFGLAAPALETRDQAGKRAARLGRQLLGFHDLACSLVDRNAAGACEFADAADGGVADAAFRRVDDALEAQVVRWIVG